MAQARSTSLAMTYAVDRLRVTIRHIPQVENEAGPPDRVVGVEMDEVDGLDLDEVMNVLHSHLAYYKVSETRTLGNWGASWGFQEIMITVAAAAQIIDLLVTLARSKGGDSVLAAEAGVERAAAFVRDNFAPQGQLVTDEVTRTMTGLTAKFHDDKCAYHVSISDDGALIDAKRTNLVTSSTESKPPA